MATTETPDLIKAGYVSVMGSELGETFHELIQDAARLHLKWNEYRLLLTPDAVEALNATAPGFFWLTQNAWWHDIVLHICRMTDRGSDKLAFEKMVTFLPTMPLRDDATARLKAVLTTVQPLRELRDRYVAHRNFDDALGRSVQPIPEPEHADAQAAIDALDGFLHAIDHKFTERAAMLYEHLDIRGGSASLLWFLQRGLNARDDDFAARRPPTRFSE
jgi:hypothetical protein